MCNHRMVSLDMATRVMDRQKVVGAIGGAIVLLILGLLEVFGVIDIISIPKPPYAVGNLFSGLQSLAMVALTAAVYVVYTQQRDLAEYTQSSILQLDDHSIPSREEYTDYLDNDKFDNFVLYHSEPVEFELSNFGRAPANDLRAELYYADGNGIEYRTAIPMMSGRWEEVADRLHSNSMTPLFHNPYGNAIASNTTSQIYTAPFMIQPGTLPDEWRTSFVHRSPPPMSVLQYAKEAVDHDSDFTIGIHIWHTDGVGLQDAIYAQYVTVPQDEIISMSDLNDGADISDRHDLKELFEIGRPALNDKFPDLEHPSKR